MGAAFTAVALAALLIAAPAPERTRAAAGTKAKGRPNLLVVQTDDQTLASFERRYMPFTHRFMSRQGVGFRNYVATTPTCCPSRSSLLTGQYAHNHAVLSNELGYPALRQKGRVLPAWLRAAGYRTAHVGKWLNGGQPLVPAPGWEDWRTLLDYRYYGYGLSIDGRRLEFGHSAGDYLTRVLTNKAVGLIREYSRRRAPFYLQLDHFAPHSSKAGTDRCPDGPVPDRRDTRRFRGHSLPQPPGFNEPDVSDKRRFLRTKRALGGTALARITARHRCRLASLRAVDRSTERLWRALRDTHEAKRTIIVFTSDNGFFAGEHRLGSGKTLPYVESSQVPLGVRLPKNLRKPGTPDTVEMLTANIDLVPTFLDYARAKPCSGGSCRRLDGRSLRPLLEGRAGWPADRAVAIEFGSGLSRERQYGTCRYEAVRVLSASYARYNRTGSCPGPEDERELYDLAADPHELENRAGDPSHAGLQTALHQRLQALRRCAGIAGRDRPPGGSREYCE